MIIKKKKYDNFYLKKPQIWTYEKRIFKIWKIKETCEATWGF